jgi:hypothetical protein
MNLTRNSFQNKKIILPVYIDVSSLTNPMTAILRLGIHGGIPIAIIENDRIRTSQVDTHPAGPSRQDEAEISCVPIEAVHQSLTQLNTRGSVQSQVFIAMIRQKNLQNIQDSRHLCENEAPMSTSEPIPQ